MSCRVPDVSGVIDVGCEMDKSRTISCNFGVGVFWLWGLGDIPKRNSSLDFATSRLHGPMVVYISQHLGLAAQNKLPQYVSRPWVVFPETITAIPTGDFETSRQPGSVIWFYSKFRRYLVAKLRSNQLAGGRIWANRNRAPVLRFAGEFRPFGVRRPRTPLATK